MRDVTPPARPVITVDASAAPANLTPLLNLLARLASGERADSTAKPAAKVKAVAR